MITQRTKSHFTCNKKNWTSNTIVHFSKPLLYKVNSSPKSGQGKAE